MDIKGKTIMVLGAYGEVGMAVCRLILKHRPSRLVLASLKEEEVISAIGELSKEAHEKDLFIPFYGNLFVRWEFRDKTLAEIAGDERAIKITVDDNLGELTEDIITSSTLYRLITEHNPHIIVDCINTATALAYRNIFSYYEALCANRQNQCNHQISMDDIYRIFLSTSMPPLIRHIQILHESLKRTDVEVYVKVGTTGTGGMGLNIPFTHGEEMPSRLLMAKSAVAGAHSMLLFALNNTPGSPVIKEVKPAAMIGWKGIGKGEIKKGGRGIKLYDCPKDKIYRLELGSKFAIQDMETTQPLKGENLKGPFIDTGENGVFSLDEFKAITAMGLMEFITPEEIAHTVLDCITGASNSKDIISALDASVLGPSYRAGFIRQMAVRHLEEIGNGGFTYGLLGPRLSKLILEASLLRLCYGFMEDVLSLSPSDISTKLEDFIFQHEDIRMAAISIGIPILLKNGVDLLFAKRDVVDKSWEERPWDINMDNINRFAEKEWIDLREENMKRWQERFKTIIREINKKSPYSGSHHDIISILSQDRRQDRTPIDPGEVSAWILLNEFKGGRHDVYESTRLMDK